MAKLVEQAVAICHASLVGVKAEADVDSVVQIRLVGRPEKFANLAARGHPVPSAIEPLLYSRGPEPAPIKFLCMCEEQNELCGSNWSIGTVPN